MTVSLLLQTPVIFVFQAAVKFSATTLARVDNCLPILIVMRLN